MVSKKARQMRSAFLGLVAGLACMSLVAGACQQLPAPDGTPPPSATPVSVATMSPVAATATMAPTISATVPPPVTPLPSASPVPINEAVFVQPISFVSERDGSAQLHMWDARGDHILAADRAGFASLRWSPDGRQGAAVVVSDDGGRSLVVLDMVSGEAHRALSAAAVDYLDFQAAAGWSRPVVQRRVGTRSELWAVDLPLMEIRPLTETSGALVAWGISGDGGWVLVSTEAEGQATTTLLDSAGGRAVEIGEAIHPDIEFSQDGRWLVVVGQDAGEAIWKARLFDLSAISEQTSASVVGTGSALEPAFVDDGRLAGYFSPDSAWLGYVVEADAARRLRLRALDGPARAEFPLAIGEEIRWIIVQSPLNRALLATAGTGASLHLLHLEQQVALPLVTTAQELTLLSEDRQSLLVAVSVLLPGGERQLLLVDMPAGSARIALRGGLRPLAVDRAGTRALVALGPEGQERVDLLDLATGGSLTTMGQSAGGAGRPPRGAIAPDSQAAWAWLWLPGDAARLVLANVPDEAGATIWPTVEVAAGVTGTSLSSDGQLLLFTRGPTSEGQIYMVQRDGTDLRAVATGRSPRWHDIGP